jgi:hypothetical protein
MATLQEYFDREARQHVARLGGLVRDARGAFENGELHRAARALRGTAQMARQEAAYRIALAVEIVARAGLSRAPAPQGLSERLEETVADLRQLVEGHTDAVTAERIAAGAVARWREVDPKAAIPADSARRDAGGAEGRAEHGAAQDRAFLAFAGREVAALADELERSVVALIADPLDREAVKRVLRQQRALLGSARLDEVPIVAETLRAVEDLARVIAKLDVPVKGEWLDVFRSARDVLHVAAPALAAHETPTPTHALSRLRTLRDELLDRYGAGEAVSVAPGEGLHQPTGLMEPPPPVSFEAPLAGDGNVIDIRVLCYRGSAALQRALELRSRFEAAVAADPDASELVDEVFDLIRLGLDE